MNTVKLVILLASLNIFGHVNAIEQALDVVKVGAKTPESSDKSTITVGELTDLLKMTAKDLAKLLMAAGITSTDADDVIDDEEKIKLVEFLRSEIAKPEFDNSDCKKGEMLFCETERRVSDRRFGRNKLTDDKRCACGPMFGRF